MKHDETLAQFLLRSSDVLFPDQTRIPEPLTVHSRLNFTPRTLAADKGDEAMMALLRRHMGRK